MYFESSFYPLTNDLITINPPVVKVPGSDIAIDNTTWAKNHFQYIPNSCACTGAFYVKTSDPNSTADLGAHKIRVEFEVGPNANNQNDYYDFIVIIY